MQNEARGGLGAASGRQVSPTTRSMVCLPHRDAAPSCSRAWMLRPVCVERGVGFKAAGAVGSDHGKFAVLTWWLNGVAGSKRSWRRLTLLYSLT